jgi:hypothetical protein
MHGKQEKKSRTVLMFLMGRRRFGTVVSFPEAAANARMLIGKGCKGGGPSFETTPVLSKSYKLL